MTKNNIFGQYRKNVNSQNGEDGVLHKIFEIIPDSNKWCVEFGAWDGKFLSNCYNLISNHFWNAVMIEASKSKFKDLHQTYKGNDKIYLINEFVNFEGQNTLDALLKSTPIPQDFDLLSIDIDGNDYYIFKSLDIYLPKVIVIEFNASIPSDIEYIQARNPKINQGSSLLSLTKLGKSKGYELICTTSWNAIFVKKEYYKLFNIPDNSPAVLWDTESEAPRLFQLYDGTIMTTKNFRLNWADMQVKETDLQKLPAFFRFYPGASHGFIIRIKKILLLIYKKILF